MTGIVLKIIGFIRNFIFFLNPEKLLVPDILLNLEKYVDLFIDWIEKINFIVPLPDIMAVFVLMLVFHISNFLLFITNWVIRRVFDVIP